MRNYICDVCGKGFQEEERLKLYSSIGMAQTLPKSDSNYIVQHLQYRLAGEMGQGDICFACQCRIVNALAKELGNIIHEAKSEEKKDA